MDMITRLTQGRHCTWWAENSVDPPSGPKQQILRGFPAQGIPFPKDEDVPRCDVCPHPKPLKRGPLPGWLSYGTGRRKTPDLHERENGKQKVDDTDIGMGARPNPQSRKTGRKKKADRKDDEHLFVRHDGHYKMPERKRVVSFVKQYQRRDPDPQPPHQSDKMIVYAADSDMKLLAVPICGVNCYQIRQDVFKAADELMSKQPEVVRIRPRLRPKEFMLELQKLATLPPRKQEGTSSSSTVGNSIEEATSFSNALAVISGEQKTEASTQTQSPPCTLSEAAPIPAVCPTTRSQAATPSVFSLLMHVPTVPASRDLEAPSSGGELQNASPSKITTLLFPQPRVATPGLEAETASWQSNQSTEWRELPRDTVALYKEKVLVQKRSSSSVGGSRETIPYVREPQRQKHWERERVASVIICKDLASKAKEQKDHWASPNQGPPDLVLRRGDHNVRQQIGQELTGEKAEGEVRKFESDRKQVEVKLRLNSMLERLNLEGDASGGGEAQALQDTGISGGLQELLRSAEEFERGDIITHSQGENHFPLTSSRISPTELEYMKAAILNHNFYPRLVSSFIEQHAAGAPAETVAKLEQVRWQVMQSWNPNNSVECDEKIRKYQEILTKLESELEKPFHEAMDFSFKLENTFQSRSSTQKRKHDYREENMMDEEVEQEQIPAMFS